MLLHVGDRGDLQPLEDQFRVVYGLHALACPGWLTLLHHGATQLCCCQPGAIRYVSPSVHLLAWLSLRADLCEGHSQDDSLQAPLLPQQPNGYVWAFVATTHFPMDLLWPRNVVVLGLVHMDSAMV